MIGVITRSTLSEDGHKISYIYDDIYKAIIKFGGIPISIYIEDYKTAISQINLCKGIILPGGDDFSFDDIRIINYLYDNDIPTLGICLGMQSMAYAFNGILNHISNHHNKKNYSHIVNIDHNSVIYKIINKDNILVNSRHKYGVISTDLNTTGISNDGIIEIIEDDKKTFFVGLEWHPESMVDYDDISKEILKYFIRGSLNDFKGVN